VLVADVDTRRIGRRLCERQLARRADSVDQALALALAAKERGEATAIGVVANAVELLDTLLERDRTPDIVTSAIATEGYVPMGMTRDTVADLRVRGEHAELQRLGGETAARHLRAMLALGRRGAEVFELGDGLRSWAASAELPEGLDLGGFVDPDLRAELSGGAGPVTWVATSGDPADIDTVDDLLLTRFGPGPLANWIRAVRGRVRLTGLPARTAWLGYGDREQLGMLVNDAVRDGRVKGPVCFVRDQFGAGAISAPLHETERMQDGSDRIADWPLVNALLNVAGDADLVTLDLHGGGSAGSSGVTVIADGSDEAAWRVQTMLRNDAGLGILRYADAGYRSAVEAAERFGLGIGA
jgi:urocanate hydratase